MSDEQRYAWRSYRRTRWGPARLVRRVDSIEVTVGEATVGIDLTDRRPAAERQANAFRDLYDDGVPVTLNGRRVATVTTRGASSGLVRRQRLAVTGDAPFVLPGMELTHRGLPRLLTLRAETGTLVASRRWAAPLNMAVVEWSFVREHDLIPPRVTRAARPEHIALWLAVKEEVTL